MSELAPGVSRPYIGLLFRRAQQAHVAVWSEVMSSEITSVQFGVLDWLAARPGLGQRDLCELLDLDRSTIADVVARLVRRGLVTRVRDEEDRRRNVLTLTEVGSSELAALLAKIDEVDKRLTSQLDAADVETLRKLLLTVVESPDVRASVDSQSD